MRLPLRIEKWVMDIQDVDFELVYQAGKDKADPLDYLSRHPSPTLGNDSTKKIVRHTVLAEHATTMERRHQQTAQDDQLEKLKKMIQSGIWENY